VKRRAYDRYAESLVNEAAAKSTSESRRPPPLTGVLPAAESAGLAERGEGLEEFVNRFTMGAGELPRQFSGVTEPAQSRSAASTALAWASRPLGHSRLAAFLALPAGLPFVAAAFFGPTCRAISSAGPHPRRRPRAKARSAAYRSRSGSETQAAARAPAPSLPRGPVAVKNKKSRPLFLSR
jgi:hypothetical protein